MIIIILIIIMLIIIVNIIIMILIIIITRIMDNAQKKEQYLVNTIGIYLPHINSVHIAFVLTRCPHWVL